MDDAATTGHNSVKELEPVIRRWRGCCQELLLELQKTTADRGQRASLAQLLATLGIPPADVHFDPIAQDFDPP